MTTPTVIIAAMLAISVAGVAWAYRQGRRYERRHGRDWEYRTDWP